MKTIIFTRPDGGLSVLYPNEGARLAFRILLADGTKRPNVIDDNTVAVPAESIMRGWPIPGVSAEWAESEEDFIARIMAKDVPAGATGVTILDETLIPSDRYFRDAWEYHNGIKINMVKAAEIHKSKLRALRAPKLVALDIEYQRADEKGNAALKNAIAKQKQALRDVTADPRIATASTPEELKAVIPVVLA